MKRLAILLILLVGSTMAPASDYVYSSDGYWYCNGVPHMRYYQPGYWSNCCYIQGYYFYKPVQIVQQPVTPTVNYTDPNWKGKLLDIAAQRVEHQAFIDAVKAMGLEGAVRSNAYSSPYYGNFTLSGSGYSTNLTNFGVNATTQYGYSPYSYQQLAAAYGQQDINMMFQQAAQLTANTQKASSDAMGAFQVSVDKAAAGAARANEILVRGHVASQVIASLALPSTPETKGFSFTITPGGDVTKNDAGVTPDQRTALLGQWQALASAKCAACHSGSTIKGNFDITKYPTMTSDEKKKVWGAISTTDANKRMPRNQDGSAAPELSLAEKRLFFLN